MNKLTKLKEEFLNGQITKYEYVDKMYAYYHAILFDYSEFMKNTNISKIEIEDDAVVFTCRDSQIKLSCAKDDVCLTPLTILNFGNYESAELKIQLQLIQDGDTIFDIGGNVGWYAIHVAKARPASIIYAFEPVPWTFNEMQKNISLNSINNIQNHNFGFSDKTGEFEFFFDPAISGNASLVNVAEKKDIQVFKCKVNTLDDYTKDKKLKIDFIKCDVEGAELLVFKGGEATIRENKPIIFAEMLRKWSAKFNYHPNAIIDFFKTLDYSPYVINGEKLQKFGLVDDDTVETNYFFLHNTRHADLVKQFVYQA